MATALSLYTNAAPHGFDVYGREVLTVSEFAPGNGYASVTARSDVPSKQDDRPPRTDLLTGRYNYFVTDCATNSDQFDGYRGTDKLSYFYQFETKINQNCGVSIQLIHIEKVMLDKYVNMERYIYIYTFIDCRHQVPSSNF